MTIKQVAEKVIKDIKSFPERARQSQSKGGPKTSWDEYKEQVQYEKYNSFKILRDTIESMVVDEVSQIPEEEFEKLYKSLHKGHYPASYLENRMNIGERILSYINYRAQSEGIVYRKPVIEYIRYYLYDLTIIARILKQVSPEDYEIYAYSQATGPYGEQGVVNLNFLDKENRLERISFEEFEKGRNSLNKGHF